MKIFFILLAMASIADAYELRILKWRADLMDLSDMSCMKGVYKAGENCVHQDWYEVPKPDGKGVGIVRWVTATQEKGPDEYGMADEEGNILIQPTQGQGIILNTRSMVMCTSIHCSILSADAKKKPIGDVVYLPMPKSPPLLLVISKNDKGQEGLAPLRADGTLGPVLVGANIKEAFANDTLGAFKVHEQPGVVASVLVDMAGQIVWAGPELRVYGVPNAINNAGKSKEGNLELRTTLMVKGPAPLRALESDQNMYVPLNGVKPVAMPANVLGIIPAYTKEPPISGNYQGFRPDDVLWWIIVKKDGAKKRFYIAEGKPDVPVEKIFDNMSKLEEIDEVTYFYKNVWNQDSKTSAPPTVHRVKTKDWRTMLDGKEAVGSTAQASFDRWLKISQATLNAEIAAQLAREEKNEQDRKRGKELRAAQDLAARETQVKVWQKSAGEFGSKCENIPYGKCTAIENAAFGLGDPGLSEFLSHQITLYGAVETRVEQACAVSTKACQEAKRIAAIVHGNEERLAEQRYQLENGWKVYTQQKIKEMQQGQVYTVPYYDNGQLKYKTMNSDEYHRVYGN